MWWCFIIPLYDFWLIPIINFKKSSNFTANNTNLSRQIKCLNDSNARHFVFATQFNLNNPFRAHIHMGEKMKVLSVSRAFLAARSELKLQDVKKKNPMQRRFSGYPCSQDNRCNLRLFYPICEMRSLEKEAGWFLFLPYFNIPFWTEDFKRLTPQQWNIGVCLCVAGGFMTGHPTISSIHPHGISLFIAEADCITPNTEWSLKCTCKRSVMWKEGELTERFMRKWLKSIWNDNRDIEDGGRVKRVPDEGARIKKVKVSVGWLESLPLMDLQVKAGVGAPTDRLSLPRSLSPSHLRSVFSTLLF